MAHQIFENTAFYSNMVPAWHKLGFVNRTGIPMTIGDVLAATDTDFEYDLLDYTATALDGEGVATYDIPDKRLVIRRHPVTGRTSYVGTVGDRYQVHTVRELDALNQALLDQGITIETYGLLGERGQRAFLTYKLPATVTVGGNDVSNMYLFTSTSFDGSTATQLRTTAIRVVCANTYAFADATATNRASVRHSSVLKGQVQAVRDQLEVAFEQAGELQALADRLVATPMRPMDVDDFLAELFPVPQDAKTTRGETIALNKRSAVADLLDAPTNAPWKGTAWGALNAVTEWADHHAPARSDGLRALRALDGKAEDIKADALNLLLV
jgi:phage/plasmid-like protein (TIGR03299 family)